MFYHGTRERFTVFDKTKRGSNTNTKISHNWFFAADKETANSYYPLGVMEYLYNKTNNESFNPTKLRENIRGNLYELYVSAKKPLVVDVANYDYTVHRENADAWTEYAELADKNGNDVIILLNAMDNQLKPKARESTVVLFRDSSQVKSATDNIGTFDKGNKDIRYSKETSEQRENALTSFTDEDVKKYVNRAVKRFGTTSSLTKAAYLTTNGSMLDFSEGQRYRVLDHRDISDVLDLPEDAEYSDGLIAFMNMGNIRLQTYGIDVSVMPNAKQIAVLRSIIPSIMRENDSFYLDVSDHRGNNVFSREYGDGTSASKIISDIRSFDQKVNRNISKNTESSQFKRWFGDWQNNPAKASKAVNRDGTPKVLYHYTDNVFSIFDISRSGANQGKTHGDGIYLSSNPNEFSYAGKNRMQLYAAIFHPFEMQLSKAEAEKIYDKYFKPFHKDTYNTYKPHVIEKLQSPTRVFDYLNEAAEKNNVKTGDILGTLGYDGVHDGSEWVAFKETQVKSATDNIGTFDGANGNIYLSRESSRDTLFSDMEAVAETEEEKSFIERLRGEIEKANSVQAELTDINRQIKEISFTKGTDRSVLPELLEKKRTLEKKLNRLDSKLYAYRGYDTFKELSQRKTKDAVTAEKLRSKAALRSQADKYRDAAAKAKAVLAERTENKRRADIARDIARRIDKIDSIAKADSKTKHIPSALRQIVRDFRAAVDTRTQNYDERIAKVNEAVKKLEEKRSRYDVGSAE